MDENLAKQLDDILKRFSTDNMTISIKASSQDEFYKVSGLLNKLQNDGYIKVLGGMGYEKAIMLLPDGLSFIQSGGYFNIIETEKRNSKYINENIEQKKSNKWKWSFLIIASLIYFLSTRDGNTNYFNDINTYLSFVGGLIGLIGFFKS